jgi:transcriptional regulator with XRE-family HTH domain
MAVSDELRKAVETCGMSRYRIARELGVSESTLSRFMSGERGLTLKTLDKLCEFLGLQLSKGRKRKAR